MKFTRDYDKVFNDGRREQVRGELDPGAMIGYLMLAGLVLAVLLAVLMAITPALFLLPLFFYIRYPLKKLENIDLEEASDLLKQNGYATVEKFRFVLKAKTYLAIAYMVFLAVFAGLHVLDGRFEFGRVVFAVLESGTFLVVACYPFLSVLINKERYLSKLILKENVNIVESTFFNKPVLTKSIYIVWALFSLYAIAKIAYIPFLSDLLDFDLYDGLIAIIPALFLLPLFFYIRYPLKKLKNIELEEVSDLLKQNGYKTVKKFLFILKAKTYLAYGHMVFFAVLITLSTYDLFPNYFHIFDSRIIKILLSASFAIVILAYPFLPVLINKERYLSKLILKEKVNFLESTFFKRPILTNIIYALWALLLLFIIYKNVATF